MTTKIKARFSTDLHKPRNAVFVVFQDKHLSKHGFQYAFNKNGEYVYLTRGDATKLLSISKMKKFDACECLHKLSFDIKNSNAFQELVDADATDGNKFVVSFAKTDFACCGHQNRCLGTFDCIKQMRNGKCRYSSFAGVIFPDAYWEKQR